LFGPYITSSIHGKIILKQILKGRQKNNSNRDEIHENNSRIHLGQITKSNAHVAKELKITPILDKLLENKRSWIQQLNT